MSGSVRRNRETSIGNPSAPVNRAPPVTQTRSRSAHPSRNFGLGRQFRELVEMKNSREHPDENAGWYLGLLVDRVVLRHAGDDQHTWLWEPFQVCARLTEGLLASVEK